MREKGSILQEVTVNEEGNAKLRLYTSAGRHLVFVHEAGESGRYEYRGIVRGSAMAPIGSGEEYCSD